MPRLRCSGQDWGDLSTSISAWAPQSWHEHRNLGMSTAILAWAPQSQHRGTPPYAIFQHPENREIKHSDVLPATGSPKAQDSETLVFWSFTFIMCTFAYLNIKYYCQTFKMKERNARYGFEPSQNWHKLISGPSFKWDLTKALSSPVPETWSCTFAWKRNVLGKMEIWNVAFNDKSEGKTPKEERACALSLVENLIAQSLKKKNFLLFWTATRIISVHSSLLGEEQAWAWGKYLRMGSQRCWN